MVDHFDQEFLQGHLSRHTIPQTDSLPFEHIRHPDNSLKDLDQQWNDEFDSLRTDIVHRFADAKESYLLSVFGSYENAKQAVHLYVFEEHGFEFVQEGETMKVFYNFRVRPKTKEELAAESEQAPPQGTLPRDLNDIHEWMWIDHASYNEHIECVCGYRPHNQEEMDEHIPPV